MSGLNVLFNLDNSLVKHYGSKFVAMDNAYDKDLRNIFHNTANELNIDLLEGNYVGVLGPVYETPAEVSAYNILGGDLIGMSTVNEVIIARHCLLKTAVLSIISNIAGGDNEANHENIVKAANIASDKLSILIETALMKL
jgi:purine nucleoside phosphorylase